MLVVWVDSRDFFLIFIDFLLQMRVLLISIDQLFIKKPQLILNFL